MVNRSYVRVAVSPRGPHATAVGNHAGRALGQRQARHRASASGTARPDSRFD